MVKTKKPINQDMAAAKDTSTKDSTVKDLTASFLQVLDSDDVVAKLAEILSASVHLMLDEKLGQVNKRLDKIIQDNKNIIDRINLVEQEYDRIKNLNSGLRNEVNELKIKVNQLEQGSRKNTLLIAGIKETFAERVDDGGSTDNPSQNIREDTVKTVCTVIKEACNITIHPSDIQAAYRLNTKRNTVNLPRPLLVTFHTSSLRNSVVGCRHPKQTLSFRGANIYFNDYLTAVNSSLFRKARDMVKHGDASSTWIREGQIFVKWSLTAHPTRITSIADLVPT
jgi:hypothetical protein